MNFGVSTLGSGPVIPRSSDNESLSPTKERVTWLNAVEGLFAKLTRRRLKHGVFHSLVDLPAAINRFITEHNQTPSPLIWKADPNDIIAAVKRGFQTTV